MVVPPFQFSSPRLRKVLGVATVVLTLTMMTIVAPSPLARVGMVTCTSRVEVLNWAVPRLVVALVRSTWVGNTSLIRTLLSVTVPRFWTVMLKVKLSPTLACRGETDLVNFSAVAAVVFYRITIFSGIRSIAADQLPAIVVSAGSISLIDRKQWLDRRRGDFCTDQKRDFFTRIERFRWK